MEDFTNPNWYEAACVLRLLVGMPCYVHACLLRVCYVLACCLLCLCCSRLTSSMPHRRWWNDIGIPQLIGHIFLMLGPDILTVPQYNLAAVIFNRADWHGRFGANLVRASSTTPCLES